jgi:uncharacterized protein involved in exopolysaccharide biosynthesis
MSSAYESSVAVRPATSFPTAADAQSPWVMLAVLWRGRFLIAGVATTLALITAATIMAFPREYKASAAFVPQEANAAPAGLGVLAAQFGISAPRAMTTSPQFYADLLEAREVLRDVLETSYKGSDKTGYEGTLLAFLRVRGNTPDETMVRAVQRMRALADVKTNRQTGVVSVEVRTRDPEISRQVVNRLLALVNEYNLKRRQSQGRAEREFAEQRLAEARRELGAAESALSEFNARNRTYGDFSTLTAQAARLQRQVSIAQQLYVSLATNFESAKIEEVRNTPVITVIERPEGFVEPAARGTIKKSAVALMAGALFGALFVLTRDFVQRSRARGRTDLEELLALLRASWLGALTRRRHPA